MNAPYAPTFNVEFCILALGYDFKVSYFAGRWSCFMPEWPIFSEEYHLWLPLRNQWPKMCFHNFTSVTKKQKIQAEMRCNNGERYLVRRIQLDKRVVVPPNTAVKLSTKYKAPPNKTFMVKCGGAHGANTLVLVTSRVWRHTRSLRTRSSDSSILVSGGLTLGPRIFRRITSLCEVSTANSQHWRRV